MTRRALVSWRIRFGVFAAAQLALIFVLSSNRTVTDSLQGLFDLGGPTVFLWAPALAGYGIGRAVIGRFSLFWTVAGGLLGLFALLTVNNTLFVATQVLGLAVILTLLGKLLSILALVVIGANLVFGGPLPGIGDALVAAGLYQPGSSLAEIGFVVILVVVPLIADPVADWLA